MLRLLQTRSIQNTAQTPFIQTSLCSLSQHWTTLQNQTAPFTQSAVKLAAPQSPAQLQQQQTQQQQLRQQLHPQQHDHLSALQKDPALCRKVLVNRLLYRSRQRGFLEMDLLVGIWAEKQVPQLSENMLRQFEVVLDQENPDLYKWLTGQEQPPTSIAENSAYQALVKDVSIQLRDHIDQSARAPEGKAWVRGWDDWSKASEVPVEAGPLAAK